MSGAPCAIGTGHFSGSVAQCMLRNRLASKSDFAVVIVLEQGRSL